MKFKALFVSAICLTSLCCWANDDFCTSRTESIARVKNECGFDLQMPFVASTTRAVIESTGQNSFRARFDVQPSRWTQKAKVQVIFNCLSGNQRVASSEEATTDQHDSKNGNTQNNVSAAAIIEEEDAGGRYARHVAFERAITAANWQGTVAYVDSQFGDGQRTPLTFLLACDNYLSRPCIEIHVDPAMRRPGKKLDSLVELIRSIAHTDPFKRVDPVLHQ